MKLSAKPNNFNKLEDETRLLYIMYPHNNLVKIKIIKQ